MVLKINGKKTCAAYLWLIVLLLLAIKSAAVLFSLCGSELFALKYGFFIIPPLLLLISFSFLFSERAGNIYLLALDLFLSLLFIADIIYARAFGHLLNIYMIFTFDNMNDLSESAFAMMRWTDYLMLTDVPALFFIIRKSPGQCAGKKRTVLFLLAALFGCAFLFFRINGLNKSRELENIEKQPVLISPAGYHIYDIAQLIYEQTDSFDEEEIAEVKSWHESNKALLRPDPAFADLEGLIKGKNIIAVQFESLENFLIGRSVCGQQITPNINGLLKNSIYFSGIIAQVRDGNSSDAELMFNSSMYPVSRGSTFFRFGKNAYASLPKLIKKQGYATMAVHGDERTYWNRDEAFLALGFDEYIDEGMFSDKSAIGMGISDRALFSQSFLEIKKLKEPYYLFIITLTSHMPFRLDEEEKYLDLPFEGAYADYLQSIHYTDKMFGEFYDRLIEEGCDDTVFIIYGDHEGIHKYYKANSDLPENDSRIPFIIYIPGIEGFASDKIGGQVDMMPTLAFLLGLDCKEYDSYVMGRNLLGKFSGSAISPTGETAEEADYKELLSEAQRIADMSIRGNYAKRFDGR